MPRKRLVLVAFVAALLSSCRPDELSLQYRYEEPAPSHVEYIVDARARASWDIGEPGQGSYRVVFEVTEDIEPVDGGDAIVTVTMTPREIEEDGLLSPGSERRSFALRIGSNGEKLEVLEVDGVSATALDDDELALIGTYRPPLPLEPVGLGDTWDAEQQLSLGSVFQQVETVGELAGLKRDEDGDRVAGLTYEGEGPLSQTLRLPQGDAALTGDTRIDIDARLNIDRGSLVEASSSTTGDFEARVVPDGGTAPIVGNLRLDLQLELHSVES